jgi:hypothetical protein
MNIKNILNSISVGIGQLARSLWGKIREYLVEILLLIVGLMLLLFAFPSLAELKTMLIVLLAELFCLWLIYRSASLLKALLPDLHFGQMALGVHLSVGMIILGVYFVQ